MDKAIEGDSQEPPIDVIFVANEGVLISVQGKKVLIDALFDKPHPDYAAPSQDTLEKMVTGQIPFDDIGLILITHNHPDHFSAGPVARFLEHNTETVLIAASDTVSALKENIDNWENVQDRIFSCNLGIGESTERTVRGIDVRIMRTLHSGDLDSPHNLMYLLKTNDRTIFHEGDSDGKLTVFKQMGLEKEKIDLALVHFWFPLQEEGFKILSEVIKPEHVGLIHLPTRLISDAPSKIDMVRSNYKDIFLFLEPGEKKSLR